MKASFFRPATINLMTRDGACSSYSAVLARLLKSGGYRARMAQRTVIGILGAIWWRKPKKQLDSDGSAVSSVL